MIVIHWSEPPSFWARWTFNSTTASIAALPRLPFPYWRRLGLAFKLLNPFAIVMMEQSE